MNVWMARGVVGVELIMSLAAMSILVVSGWIMRIPQMRYEISKILSMAYVSEVVLLQHTVPYQNNYKYS